MGGVCGGGHPTAHPFEFGAAIHPHQQHNPHYTNRSPPLLHDTKPTHGSYLSSRKQHSTTRHKINHGCHLSSGKEKHSELGSTWTSNQATKRRRKNTPALLTCRSPGCPGAAASAGTPSGICAAGLPPGQPRGTTPPRTWVSAVARTVCSVFGWSVCLLLAFSRAVK